MVVKIYQIDGINISELNPDRVCLNCVHWQANIQLKGAAEGVICRLGNGHTNPTDSCSQFEPTRTSDCLQNPNNYHDKSQKLLVFKRF